MAAVTSTWSVTYGSIVIGGAGAYLLKGEVQVERDYEQLRVEFSATVTEATEALFNSRCAALEAEFQKPRQTLSIKIRNSTETFSHSANTGFNAEPHIAKVPGSKDNTSRSREYRCSVRVNLPATAAAVVGGETGLLVAFLGSSVLPTGRRVVSMSGTYTALASNSARAQYEAQIETYAENVVTAVDNTLTFADDWDAQIKPNEVDWQNKLCRWSRTYVERIFADSDDNDREDALRNVKQLAIPLTVTPFGTPGVPNGQPTRVRVFYSCEVVRSVEADLVNAWRTIIRPRVKSLAKLAVNGSDDAQFVEGSPVYNFTDHTMEISATLIVYGSISVLFSSMRTTKAQLPPWVLVPAHSTNPHAKVVMPTAGTASKAVLIDLLVRGDEAAAREVAKQLVDFDAAFVPGDIEGQPAVTPAGPYSLNDLPGLGATGGGWVRLPPQEDVVSQERLGDSESGDSTELLTEYTVTVAYIYAAPAEAGQIAVPSSPSAGSGGGSGGAVNTGGGSAGAIPSGSTAGGHG